MGKMTPFELERNKKYKAKPLTKYKTQRSHAIRDGKKFELTFEDWWKIWQDSGHWEERGRLGYQMCRYGDEGPYSVDNVYIAHHSQNKRDAYINGKTCHPPFGTGSVSVEEQKRRQWERTHTPEFKEKKREYNKQYRAKKKQQQEGT
jgi:hypothetical protein